ncbi:hypothetical protein BT63DRAFT_171198 [Microthyrium microscopicum]|uniref:N-acetyltransferase domain-containing protein n=1 Tax=Microthyrium microscopicum TaxID=703497 RepID=A0A6A6USL3_9PEZI|nr:hypothetical protein BT63DRAFT_171198 [Microthyrium microscopicum]
MAEQHHSLSPSVSPPEENPNDVTRFPPLTETPAKMSPAPPGHSFGAPLPGSLGAEETEEDDIESHGPSESTFNPNTQQIFRQLLGDDDDDEDEDDSPGRSLLGLINRSRGLQRQTRETKRETTMSLYKCALTPKNLDSCVMLEQVCFPGTTVDANAIAYRLAKGSGLSIGLFTTVHPDDEETSLPTYASAPSAEGNSPRRIVLLAHLLATTTTNSTVTSDDETLPSDWNVATSRAQPTLGNKLEGKTVAIVNFAVLPQMRARHAGGILIKSFVSMVKSVKAYRKIAVAAPEALEAFFEQYQFETVGKGWVDEKGEKRVDMVTEFGEDDSDSEG